MKNIVVSIHQPNYLPWLGYFHKIFYSDVFVFLDSVQYTPKTYTNRCYVLQNQSSLRLSVPASIKKWDTPINEVFINTKQFARKHIATIRSAYLKSPWYSDIIKIFY